jgi:hypothetical protein
MYFSKLIRPSCFCSVLLCVGRLLKGWYLLVITKSQVAAKVLGCTIYQVQEVKAFPFSAKKGAADIASGPSDSQFPSSFVLCISLYCQSKMPLVL